MLKVNETDSFPVELGKNLVQSFLGTTVATVGVIGALAAIGTILDKRKPVFLKPNQKVVTIDETQE